MQYICYISKERVDSLFEQAFDGIVDEETTGSSRERSRGAQGGVEIPFLNLLRTGLSYGRKDAASTQFKIRKNVTSRLMSVLEQLQTSNQVEDLNQVVAERGRLSRAWYSFASDLSVKLWDPRSATVDLIGRIGDHELELSCTKANFSGLSKEGDIYIPSSTNRFLFEGGIALPMFGIMTLVAGSARCLQGTPLCLMLNPLDIDLGAFNDVEI